MYTNVAMAKKDMQRTWQLWLKHNGRWNIWPKQKDFNLQSGLHNSFRPTIRDGSTWSKFRVCGEHGDLFLFSNLDAHWFSENRALVLTFLDVYIKIFIACVFKGSQEQSFPSDTLTLTTYSISRNGSKKFNTLVSTWSSVSSWWEHVKRKMHPCLQCRSYMLFCRN